MRVSRFYWMISTPVNSVPSPVSESSLINGSLSRPSSRIPSPYWPGAPPVRSLARPRWCQRRKRPAFPPRIGGSLNTEPTLDGRRVVVLLAGAPAPGEEEEEEGQEGLVELQLFVCSTQAWARRGRRSPRYRADGAQKAGAKAPGRGERLGLRAEL